MMKSVISEIIKIELLKDLLAEGRLEDAKSKYPQDTEIVDYFVSQDPSVNNKYLPWEMKVYKQLQTTNQELLTRHKELIANLIKVFHNNTARLQQKDINQYKTLADLHNILNPIIKASEEKIAQKEKEEKGVKKLYEDDDWLLVRPLTHEASCKYGANTQWCTASKNDSEHFKNYTEGGILIYLIHKKSNNKFAFYNDLEDADDDSMLQIYNPIDYDINEEGEFNDIKNFLDGLVSGNMEEYLDYEGEYDDYGDDVYEIYKVKSDGTKTLIDEEYDEDGVIFTLLLHIWEHYMGRGTGRNTVNKIKNFLSMFDIELTLDENKMHWVMSHEETHTRRGNDFKNDFRRNRIRDQFRDILVDVLNESYAPDAIEELIDKHKIPLVIIGDGFSGEKEEEEQKGTDLGNVMTKRQAKAILNSYNGEIENITKEMVSKSEESLKNLVSKISVSKNVLKIIKNCFEVTRKHEHNIPQEFYRCVSRSMPDGSTENIRIDVRNEKTGRYLRRNLRRLKYENSNIVMNWYEFTYELFKLILEKYEKQG